MDRDTLPTAALRTVNASEFRARCLQLLDEMAATGQELIITKRGRPVARLVPYRVASPNWFGRDRDSIKILGDIMAPIDVEWEAEANPDRTLNP